MNLDDYSETSKTKCLIYGPPKSGKTALVGKLAAAGFNLIWFDLENGVKTLLNTDILAKEFRKNVSVISIPDHRLYPVAIDTVREVFRGGLKKICHDHGKISCPLCAKNQAAKTTEIDILKLSSNDIIVIDSISQLSNSSMNRSILKELQKHGREE